MPLLTRRLGLFYLLTASAMALLTWLFLALFFSFFPAHDVPFALLCAIPFGYGVLIWLCNRVVYPWRRLVHVFRLLQQFEPHGQSNRPIATLNFNAMASVMGHFAAQAQDAFTRCHLLQNELHVAQRLITQLDAQQHALIHSSSREMSEQYRSVLSYAHYLDDHIRRHASDTQLRYDFDDVCESGFNLRLIAQSLELLGAAPPTLVAIPVTDLLHQTVIALAPSLERRAMKLSSLGTDEQVQIRTDLPSLAHAVWIMLLGIIRYAAAESTLRLRCLPVEDGRTVLLSIVVSELAPGALSPEERHAYLERQLQHLTPHMFAETIRQHGNLQLAELLIARLQGRIHVLPLSSHACEISLFLPAAEK